MMCHSEQYNKCFFTLVELLLIVAIIAILASILLPALSKARQRADDIHCLNNLKQLVTGSTFYCDDNDGYIMLTSNAGNQRDWFNLLKNDQYVKYSGTYPEKTSPYHCLRNPLPTASNYVNCGWTNYGIDYWLAGARISRQKISMALFTDAYDPVKKESNYHTLGSRGSEPWSFIYPVHNKVTNIGFTDGSAKGYAIPVRPLAPPAGVDLGEVKAEWYWPVY